MVMHYNEKPVKLLNRYAWAALIVGIGLMAIKFTAYLITGSAAILSDAAESIVNVITAGFAIYSLSVANKPPDEEHPYGHGKIEFFAAALEGSAILIAAVWIIYKAISEILAGPHIDRLDTGLFLVAFAAIVNGVLGYYLVKIGRKEGSIILESDGHHVLTDVVTSAGVVVGLIVVVLTKWIYLDAIVAMLAALNIIYTGYKLLRNAFFGMMDSSSADDELIIRDLLSKPFFHDVCGYHKLRHRKSGNFHFVDFHLILPRHFTIEQAHAIATAIEAQVATALGDASVMAHVEPCRRQDCPRCRERPTSY